MNLTISPTTESVTCSEKLVLTYSALNTFRNCPRKYKHRYLDNLRPRERAEALSFGGIVHSAIELWYRSVRDPNRLESVLNHLDLQFPDQNVDDLQKSLWHLARAMFTGYAKRRGKWLLNTSNCFSYQRPCEYLSFCQSGFNPNVADNLYEIALPHEELSPVDSYAPSF